MIAAAVIKGEGKEEKERVGFEHRYRRRIGDGERWSWSK